MHMLLALLFNAFFKKSMVKENLPINLAISFRSPTILEILTVSKLHKPLGCKDNQRPKGWNKMQVT